jgi:hypothetical protein
MRKVLDVYNEHTELRAHGRMFGMLDSTLRGSYVRASELRRNAIRNRWRCEFGFRCNAGPMQTRKDSKDEADSNGDGHLRLTRHHCDSIFDSTPVSKKVSKCCKYDSPKKRLCCSARRTKCA